MGGDGGGGNYHDTYVFEKLAISCIWKLIRGTCFLSRKSILNNTLYFQKRTSSHQFRRLSSLLKHYLFTAGNEIASLGRRPEDTL